MKKRLQYLSKEERYTLQKVCRQQAINKLLADIATDMTVCQLEGWDSMEYINDLFEILEHFRQKAGNN